MQLDRRVLHNVISSLKLVPFVSLGAAESHKELCGENMEPDEALECCVWKESLIEMRRMVAVVMKLPIFRFPQLKRQLLGNLKTI